MNANRARAKQIISLSPGIHLRKLQKILGTSFSTTRYHVESLQRESEIVSLMDGRYCRLFPSGTEENLKSVYSVLQRKAARRVLSTLAASERGLSNAQLSD